MRGPRQHPPTRGNDRSGLNYWTFTTTVALLVWPLASAAVSVYVVVLCGDTWTQRLCDGQTGWD